MDFHASTTVDDRFRVNAMDGERIGRKTLFLEEIWQCLQLDLACSMVTTMKCNFWMHDSQMVHHTLDGWKNYQCSGAF
jgi:hypothetical protein